MPIALLCLWRYAAFGQRAPVLVHDNLDSAALLPKLVADSGQLFASDDSIVPNIMGGIPRAYFDTELNVFSLLSALPNAFAAYVINQMAIVVIAYLGMLLLVRCHLVERDGLGGPLIAHGVALAFAFLPHWPAGGLSVAGTPLLLHTFLELRRGAPESSRLRQALSWSVFVLFPFYSSVVLSFGMLLVFGVVMLVDLARRAWTWRSVTATALLTLAYGVAEHRLVKMQFAAAGEPSHRVEFEKKLLSLEQGARQALDIFVNGQYHAPSLHTHVVLPIVGLALVLARRRVKGSALLWSLLAGLVLTSLVYGGLNLEALEPLRERITLLRTFNFGRVHWLQPLLWYGAFAVALQLLSQRFRGAPGWLVLPLVLQAGYVLWQAPMENRIGGRSLPYRAFYAPELFGQIRNYIGLPPSSYRVVSVGMHPAVALYNGFHTLDGYIANYPLGYKHRFREIIAPELAQSAKLRAYFDGWGNRAYIFSRELDERCKSLCTKDVAVEVRRLELDARALYAQGGRYVLSAVPIASAPGLEFARRFESPEAAWSVYLYTVAPEPATSAASTAPLL